MSVCPRCGQSTDLSPLGDVEVLGVVLAALSATSDPDPFKVLDVIASRCPGATGRAQVAAMLVRVLVLVGDPKRARRLVGEQQLAEWETGVLEELWQAPPAEEPDREAARELADEGMAQEEIADTLGVAQSTVSGDINIDRPKRKRKRKARSDAPNPAPVIDIDNAGKAAEPPEPEPEPAPAAEEPDQ